MVYNQCQQGTPRFPASGEVYAAFPSKGDTGEEARGEFERLEEFEKFLREHAGETVFLRIELEASHIRTDSDDPLKAVFELRRYTVAYAASVIDKNACNNPQSCPDAIVRISDDPNDSTVDASVRIDRDLYGGVAVAVQRNTWFPTQVSITQNGVRLKGLFFNGGAASHADQLTVTPYILRPLGEAAGSEGNR